MSVGAPLWPGAGAQTKLRSPGRSVLLWRWVRAVHVWTALALMPVLLVYTASGTVLLLGLQNRFKAGDSGLVQRLVVGAVQLHMAQVPAAPPPHTPTPITGPGHALFLALSLLLCAAILCYSATGAALAWRGAWRRSSAWCVLAGCAAVSLAIALQFAWWRDG